MKIKNLSLALALALTASNAYSTNSSVELRASSDLIIRGQELTNSEGTVGIGLKFDNVVFDGLYVSGDFDTIEITPVDSNVRVRSDIEVGYKSVWNDFSYSASLARVVNPVTHSSDYSELRLRGKYSFVYGEIGQGFTNDVNTDTYFSLGVEGRPFNDKFLLGASTSVISYNDNQFGPSNVEWNNFQLYTSYNVWNNLNINAGASIGGDKPSEKLPDELWVGVSYRL
jgi:hypothetical protein